MNRQEVNNRFAADIANSENLLPSEKAALIDQRHKTEESIQGTEGPAPIEPAPAQYIPARNEKLEGEAARQYMEKRFPNYKGPAPAPIKCNQYTALMINGFFCHELHCPNTHKKFNPETGEWIKIYTCPECGNECPEGENCCSID